MGCGRVGSTPGPEPGEARPHRRRHRPERRRVPPARSRLRRHDRSPASASTGRCCSRPASSEADGVRRGLQRRQLQHPLRPGGPGDLRRRQRGGPDLRPGPGRGLRAARHPHRGHRALDRRPDAAAAAAGRVRAAVARPVRHGAADGGPRRPLAGSAAPSTQIEEATGARVAFLFRLGAGMVPKRGTVLQDGDLVYAAVADARLAEVEADAQPPPAERRQSELAKGDRDARRHRRGRQRRPVHRRASCSRTATRCC